MTDVQSVRGRVATAGGAPIAVAAALALAVALALATMLALAAPATAGPSGAGAVQVRLHPVAQVSQTGTVTGRVRVSCPVGMSVLEALVTLSQDDQQLFGQGAIGGVTCTGRRAFYSYSVAAFDQPFHPGRAYASAYVLVIDGSGTSTSSGGDTRTVRVR